MNVQNFESSSGYTLVESIIAIVLLVTVLTPLSSVLVKLATNRTSKQKIEMYAIAQATIERAVSEGKYIERSEVLNEAKWSVKEAYGVKDNLVYIRITVSRIGRTMPQVTLATVRLKPASS